MKTPNTIPHRVFATKLLEDYAKLLLKSGFTIIYSEPRDMRGQTYFSFERNGCIGYVQEEHGEFSFTSKHKPNSCCGTGFQILKTYKPSVKDAEATSKTMVPAWAWSDLPYVEKYSGLTEYLEYENRFFDHKTVSPSI